MGALRFLLAVCVVSAHTLGPSGFGVGGQLSVEIFFLVSGFLISFILNESPRYASIRDFYVSRGLRIFPLYFIVTGLSALLVVTLAALGNKSLVLSTFEESDTFAKLLLSLGNIGILFQDMTFFLSTDDGATQLVHALDAHGNGLYAGLLTPQAWSLSLELMFYLLAPLVIRSNKALFALLALGIALRCYFFFWTTLENDPWFDRFFPIQIAVFALGALSHKLISPAYRSSSGVLQSNAFRGICYVAVLAFIAFYTTIPGPDFLKQLLAILSVATTLPVLFSTQTEWKLDGFLSNLSFPIYLWHVLVINLISVLFSKIGFQDGFVLFALTLVVSIFLSLAFNVFVDSKIQIFRGKFKVHSLDMLGSEVTAINARKPRLGQTQ